MKTMKSLALFSILLLVALQTKAQGFPPPAEGKAAIYFARVSMFGGAISFQYFHNDEFVGQFKGKNYMRMEVDPGEQLFWASSENKEFLTADLEAGKTYIVVVDIIMGIGKARVGFSVLDNSNTDVRDRAIKLINSKAPIVTKESTMKKVNAKLEKKNFIPEKLEMYEKVWKKEKNFKHLSKDMAIPAELLK
mgnify:CR=1 FL=1